jgi:hypothetical protein
MSLLSFLAAPSRRRKDANGYLHVTGCHLLKEQIAPYPLGSNFFNSEFKLSSQAKSQKNAAFLLNLVKTPLF